MIPWDDQTVNELDRCVLEGWAFALHGRIGIVTVSQIFNIVDCKSICQALNSKYLHTQN